MKLFKRINCVYLVLYFFENPTFRTLYGSGVHESAALIIISNYRQRFFKCLAYRPGLLQNKLTVSCLLVWWVEILKILWTGLRWQKVSNSPFPSLLKLAMFSYFNDLGVQSRTISVFLNEDVGFVKPYVMVEFIRGMLTHSWLQYMPIHNIGDVFLHPNTV